MIKTLYLNELKRAFATPLAWILLAVCQLILAWAFFTELEAYDAIQQRLVSRESLLGITSLVAIPAMLNALNLVMLIVPLLTMRSFASEFNSQQFSLLLASPLKPSDILFGKYFAVLSITTGFWLLVLLQILLLQLGTSLDTGRILLLWLQGILVIAIFAGAGLWLSSMTRHAALAAILSYGLFIALRAFGHDDDQSLMAWFSLTSHLKAAQLGLFSSTDIIFFALLNALFLLLTWTRLIRIKHNRERWSGRLAITLLITLLAISWPVLNQHEYSKDFSDLQHNTLSAASRDTLSKLDQPLSFTVYVSDNAVLKKPIQQLVNRFKRERPDLAVNYTDPQNHPEASRALGITQNGEILVRYNERQQLVKKLSEEEIRKTLLHLSSRQQGWIVNLQGHGELDLLHEGLYGASILTQNLQARGYLLRNFNLVKHGQLPDNTELVIIAAPTKPYTQTELQLLQAYLLKGGNLLWLQDSDSQLRSRHLPMLPQTKRLPGVIVDATAAKLKLATPDNAVVTSYPAHMLSSGLTRHTLFKQAVAIEPAKDNEWRLQTSLKTGALSWNETGSMKGEINRDPVLLEQQGPLPVLLAYQKDPPKGKSQKVVITGDSDFLRNNSLGQGDNLLLALNIFHWLSSDNSTITANKLLPSDQVFELTTLERGIFGILFLIVVPVILALLGWFIPYRRKRAI